MSQAVFHGPAGAGQLYVELLSPDASALLVAGEFVPLGSVVSFGAALLSATEKTIAGEGTGVYEWDPETHALIGDGHYPFRALSSALSTPSEAASAEGYLDWRAHAQVDLTSVRVNVKRALSKVSVAQLTVRSPVLLDGSIDLVQGDDYLSRDNRALQWSAPLADE